MKRMMCGAALAVLAVPALAAPTASEYAARLSAEPVPLEPLVVTPNSAAIDAMSQAIVAQLLEQRRWKLPNLGEKNTPDLS